MNKCGKYEDLSRKVSDRRPLLHFSNCYGSMENTDNVTCRINLSAGSKFPVCVVEDKN